MPARIGARVANGSYIRNLKAVADLEFFAHNFKKGMLCVRRPGRFETLASARLVRIENEGTWVKIFAEDVRGESAYTPLASVPIVLKKMVTCRRLRNGNIIIKLPEFDLWLVARSILDQMADL